DADAVFFALNVEVEYLVHHGLVGVEELDEGLQTTLVLEQFFLAGTLVAQQDAHAGVEEGKLAQALGQNVPAEVNVGEGFLGRLEVNLRARAVGITDSGQRRLRYAMHVGLFPDLAAAANGQHQLLGEGVHHRDTYTVQTAGHLVAVVVELTAGV